VEGQAGECVSVQAGIEEDGRWEGVVCRAMVSNG